MPSELVFCHPDGGIYGLQFPMSNSISQLDISTMKELSNFVNLLSRHKNLSSIDLEFHRKGDVRAQRIINHAFSLNVQQLTIACLFKKNKKYSHDERVAFPLSLSGSKTLEHLSLRGSCGLFDEEIVLTSAQRFSSLTTLLLHSITLYDGFLSMCPNLKNLTLFSYRMTGSPVLRISHPQLSNLTLEKGECFTHTVNGGRFHVSAPELASLHFFGFCPQMFTTGDGFPCLENAHLSFHSRLECISGSYAPTIVNLLQQFRNVKHLTLSMEIIERLNSSEELISHRPCPLANLKSLTLLPEVATFVQHKHTRVIMSPEVQKYLLSSSPKATLTEVLTLI
ncbi:uncharacterized protein LOC143562067 [Bidens hawaiensis]|uniref:uncharacterized protein LOC143562067 n=1 Tax=Bidens hawaiensis TaxID=980011 RepID=UPI00404A4CD1